MATARRSARGRSTARTTVTTRGGRGAPLRHWPASLDIPIPDPSPPTRPRRVRSRRARPAG